MAGGVVDVPRAEVGLHHHTRHELALRHHDLHDAHALALARVLVLAQRLLWHSALARHLEPALERALRVLGRARHVLVPRVHPELAPRGLHDRRSQAVVIGVRVGATDQAHVLQRQPGLAERLLEPAKPAWLRQPGIHEHDTASRRDGERVHVRHARPAHDRQPQPPEAAHDLVGPRQVALALRAGGAHAGSTSTPGLRMPRGSSAFFAARSASANGSGRCWSYQGRWSRPTAWWWVTVPPSAITASDTAAFTSAHCSSSEPRFAGASSVKYGAAPSGYTCVNRTLTLPAPYTSRSEASARSRTPPTNSSIRSQVIAVSNVSLRTPAAIIVSRKYGA